MSSAFIIEGRVFEIAHSIIDQRGECTWPGYGPDSDRTPFQPSTTIYMHGAMDGHFHHNLCFWRCSFMDLDVTDRVRFEDNQIHSTERGVVPHGNSISGYDFHAHPSSRWWSFARNLMTRPANKTNRASWTQRETITTDGSGQFGTGYVVKVVRASGSGDASVGYMLDQNMSAVLNKLPDQALEQALSTVTLKVLGGPSTGQSRVVVGWDKNTSTLTLESPLDAYFQPGLQQPGGVTRSVVTIVASFGQKALVGNVFNWTEVVQWYSNTLGGVISDNTLTDCNVRNGGNVGNASVGAYGACYNGHGPVWFTEFTGNTMVRSDGISLLDNQINPAHLPRYIAACPIYRGHYIRWSVVRRNTISGVSVEAAGARRCGAVSNSNKQSTDLVSERNHFHCPSGAHIGNALNQAKWANISCSHCTDRN